MGLELNPLLPQLGSLQRQLFSPYGGDSAPPPPLSNDAFLTDTPERALDSGGKVNMTQCLLGCRGKKQGTPPLTKPPFATVYLHALSSDTDPTETFINPVSSVTLGGTQAATKIMLQWSWMCLFPTVAGLNAAKAPLWWSQCWHPHFCYHCELRGGHYYLLQLIFIQDYEIIIFFLIPKLY